MALSTAGMEFYVFGSSSLRCSFTTVFKGQSLHNFPCVSKCLCKLFIAFSNQHRLERGALLTLHIFFQTYRRLGREGVPKGNSSSFLVRWLWNEANPSANHAKLEFNIKARTTFCLNWVALILAYAHWIFGTLVFSSTLFIGTLDALGVIARYLASAIICRMILLVELAGIRGAEEVETTR